MAERFLAAARRLGDHLAQGAVEQEGAVSWLSAEASRHDGQLGPIGIGLYNGLPGMALFFAHLGRLTGDERDERLARLAAQTVRRRIALEAGALQRIGAFSGWGGLVYTLTHLGLLWEAPELLDEAESLALGMASGVKGGRENTIESDQVFDLGAGAAGCAASLLALHRRRPSPALLEIAVRCGGHLLAHAIRGERGTSWPHRPGASEVPLTGFAHGTAGISWALAALAHTSGEERFREAARGALRYERSWFCAERGNWPDLRESRKTRDSRPFYGWCHGAPGIGLGRIGSLSDLDDPEMPGEIRAALRSTLEEGFGFSDCLCHGNLGNLELVREASRALGDPELTAEAGRLAGRILARIESAGPRCGTSGSVEVPGLMTGLAGIGYGLLRAAAPDRVPCLLLLGTGGE